MEIIEKALTKEEIKNLGRKYGRYMKVVADLENGILIIGCSLHVDGEKMLLEKGGKSLNIWGGGLNFRTKEIDMTAILNLRPKLNNPSMEIIDFKRREKFFKIVKKLFGNLWL